MGSLEAGSSVLRHTSSLLVCASTRCHQPKASPGEVGWGGGEPMGALLPVALPPPVEGPGPALRTPLSAACGASPPAGPLQAAGAHPRPYPEEPGEAGLRRLARLLPRGQRRRHFEPA